MDNGGDANRAMTAIALRFGLLPARLGQPECDKKIKKSHLDETHSFAQNWGSPALRNDGAVALRREQWQLL